MLARALTAGVRVSWVTGDEVYGSAPELRRWLEEQRQPYVLAVRANERVWVSPGARVRRWTGWYRHITLALLAHALLTVTRAHAAAPAREKGGPRHQRHCPTPPSCRKRN